MNRRIVSAVLAVVVTALLGAPAEAGAQAARQAVLVTGASSGIGRRITETLAAKGHYVYAGARKQSDLDDLAKIPNVEPIRLDVTVPAEIAAAVDKVRKAGRGLHGVVNNAGVAILAPLIEVDEKDLQWQLDVNVMGVYRVTKAFAPLLLESKGRVVTISSISGILSGQLFGPYSMSKHAVEAFGDALGAELARFGVRSSLVEPGNYSSEIGRNVLARMDTTKIRGSLWEQQLRNVVGGMGNYDNGTYPEPVEVAEATVHALFDPSPKVRYMVVPAARQAEVTIRKQIEELAQLNQSHRFSIPRDSLVKMLDEALARNK